MTETTTIKKLYTAFCKDAYENGGTIWISCVTAATPAEATIEAIEACAADWGCEPSGVALLGLAAGNVQIVLWDDEGIGHDADDVNAMADMKADALAPAAI